MAFQFDQRLPHFEVIALTYEKSCDFPGRRGRHRDRGLVGFQFDQRLPFGHLIALVDEHLDQRAHRSLKAHADRASATASAPAGKRSVPVASLTVRQTASATSVSFVTRGGLANAAKMVEENPALLRLRALQAFSPSGTAHSLVLELGDGERAKR